MLSLSKLGLLLSVYSTWRIDFHDTFSPTSGKVSFRIIMVLVAHFNLELHHMNVKTAFLSCQLFEEVYMFQPEDFEVKGKEHMVCRFHMALSKPQDNSFCDSTWLWHPPVTKKTLLISIFISRSVGTSSILWYYMLMTFTSQWWCRDTKWNKASVV